MSHVDVTSTKRINHLSESNVPATTVGFEPIILG